MVLRTKITTENHQSISFHFTYIYEGPISHRLLSPSLRHIFRKYINMLYPYLLIGTGCFPVPGTFVTSAISTIHVGLLPYVFFSYVLCSLKCTTLCIQIFMCFNKLLLTLTFDVDDEPINWYMICKMHRLTPTPEWMMERIALFIP